MSVTMLRVVPFLLILGVMLRNYFERRSGRAISELMQ